MTKIAEQKSLEAYPQEYDNLLDSNVHRRIGYRQGYEQALQDITEWLKSKFYIGINNQIVSKGNYNSIEELIKQCIPINFSDELIIQPKEKENNK